jgi:hypothetical protein
MIPPRGRSLHHWYCPKESVILYFKTVVNSFSIRTNFDSFVVVHPSAKGRFTKHAHP